MFAWIGCVVFLTVIYLDWDLLWTGFGCLFDFVFVVFYNVDLLLNWLCVVLFWAGLYVWRWVVCLVVACLCYLSYSFSVWLWVCCYWLLLWCLLGSVHVVFWYLGCWFSICMFVGVMCGCVSWVCCIWFGFDAWCFCCDFADSVVSIVWLHWMVGFACLDVVFWVWFLFWLWLGLSLVLLLITCDGCWIWLRVLLVLIVFVGLIACCLGILLFIYWLFV